MAEFHFFYCKKIISDAFSHSIVLCVSTEKKTTKKQFVPIYTLIFLLRSIVCLVIPCVCVCATLSSLDIHFRSMKIYFWLCMLCMYVRIRSFASILCIQTFNAAVLYVRAFAFKRVWIRVLLANAWTLKPFSK